MSESKQSSTPAEGAKPSRKATATTPTPAKKTATKAAKKKSSPARRMTRDEKLRKLMRGKNFPHPDFRTGGGTFRLLTPQEAEEAMEQATRELDPDYRDEADVPHDGERELTDAEREPTQDEVDEIAEYEANRAGGPHA